MSLARAHLLFMAITALDLVIMLVYPIPKLLKATGGLWPFDFRVMGYSPEEAAQYMSVISNEGRLVYLEIQLRLDMFLPLLIAVSLMFTLYRLAPKLPVLYLFPVSGALFDYYENAAITQILLSDTPDASLVELASLLTGLKFASIAISLLAILWFWRQGKSDA